MMMIAKSFQLELRVRGVGKSPAFHFSMDGLGAGPHKFPGGHVGCAIGHDISQMLWDMRRSHEDAKREHSAPWHAALDTEVQTLTLILTRSPTLTLATSSLKPTLP